MNLKQKLLVGIFISCVPGFAFAQSTGGQLGAGLTEFGAIKAGSADGLVPAYSGGLAAMSHLPSASPTTGYPDPFANEKPIFVVTKDNMQKYISMLTPGEQALLTRFGSAGFQMNVYPSHRTMSYPQWVLDNTLKNIKTASLSADGEGVTGAYGGIPFPVPANGYQVMWNSFLAYQPAYCQQQFQNFLVESNGDVTQLGTIATKWAEPYYFKNESQLQDNFYRYYHVRYLTPVAEAGETYLFQYPIDFNNSDDVTYFYSPGTRRVRLAPDFRYDTPISSYGGAIDYDEIDLFYGRMDKFDFKLVGQKEMIVPYNDYTMGNTSQDAVLGKNFISPSAVRWEVHRVWVVEATLKAGERHAFSRWDFYVDEDSWHVLATESYDHAGNIYKVGFAYPWENYSQGDATSMAHTFGIYDLSKGDYELSYVQAEGNGFWQCSVNAPNMSDFTAQAIVAQAIR